METITLDMSIGKEAAFREWEKLPDSAPKQQRAAYWRRYLAIKFGSTNPVIYIAPSKNTPSSKPPAPASRLEMIKQLATKPAREVKPCQSTATSTAGIPSATRARIAKTRNQHEGRKPALKAPAHRGRGITPVKSRAKSNKRKPDYDLAASQIIRDRIRNITIALGYGDCTTTARPHERVYGGCSALHRISGADMSSFRQTVASGTRTFQSILARLERHAGFCMQYMVEGTGPMHTPEAPRHTARDRSTTMRAAKAVAKQRIHPHTAALRNLLITLEAQGYHRAPHLQTPIREARESLRLDNVEVSDAATPGVQPETSERGGVREH